MTNTAALALILNLLVGSIITVNGVSANIDEIIDSAKTVTNSANVHQLSTALEIYYMDNNAYPNVSDGPALIALLTDGGYIRNEPLDASVFTYQLIKNGQDYVLKLN